VDLIGGFGSRQKRVCMNEKVLYMMNVILEAQCRFKLNACEKVIEILDTMNGGETEETPNELADE